MLTLPLGIIFELPVVMYFLSKIGLVTPTFLRSFRRHTVVIILIVAGVITPSPDIFSQLMVAVPLYGLYEISILVSARVVKKRMELEPYI
jgi:sec-independent protein translocase protein TatC